MMPWPEAPAMIASALWRPHNDGWRSVGIRNGLMVFCRTSLPTPCRHRWDICLEALLSRSICFGCELHQRVKRNFQPWRLIGAGIHEIGIDASDDGLMGDDDDVVASLQLHDDWLQSNDHVTIGLSTPIPVIIFVLISRREILRIFLLDFTIRHPVAHARVQLVQSFPFELVPLGLRLQISGSLNRSFQCRCPDHKLRVLW